MKTTAKLWVGIVALALLTPLGLILPAHFKAGSAWGEWGADEMQRLVGYVPRGLEKLSTLWRAPLPDYAFRGWGDKGLPHLSFAYIISAALGTVAVVFVAWGVGWMLSKKGD